MKCNALYRDPNVESVLLFHIKYYMINLCNYRLREVFYG